MIITIWFTLFKLLKENKRLLKEDKKIDSIAVELIKKHKEVETV